MSNDHANDDHTCWSRRLKSAVVGLIDRWPDTCLRETTMRKWPTRRDMWVFCGGGGLVGAVAVYVLGGYWAMALTPVVAGLAFGVFPLWRNKCWMMMKDHADRVLRMGMALGAAVLVGASILVAVANPDLLEALREERLLDRLYNPAAALLQVVAFAAWAMFTSFVYPMFTRSDKWRHLRSGVALVGVTSAFLLPAMLIWVFYSLMKLALLGMA